MYRSCALLFLTVASVLPLAAGARDLAQDEIRDLAQSRKILSLEQLMAIALERHPKARLLEAEVEKENHQYRYECELLLPDGTVRELEFDAVDGRLIHDREDD